MPDNWFCGCAPDCAERAACALAGQPGHMQCGMCAEHGRPRHQCGCLAVDEAPGSRCRSACTTKDHASFGECVRASNVGIDRTALAKGRQ